MAEETTSCVEPAQGPIGQPGTELPSNQAVQPKETKKMAPLVGKPAPDFEANVFFGDGFKTIKLSDFKGKWILLCFYPGDFTFV